MAGKARPGIDCNPPAGNNIVYELTVTRSEIEHACVSGHAMAEKRTPKGFPEYIAPRVGSETGFMVSLVHATRFHPKVSPRIIASPTCRARKLSVFPPLLTPTRG